MTFIKQQPNLIFCAIIYIESDALLELIYNSQESYNLGEWI